jgi:UDP-glucose 4-epimerase
VIYGNDYPTRDGTAVRDYIHVQDIVDAHLNALDHLRAGGGSSAINLGTGIGHSVKQVVHAVEGIVAKEVRIRLAPRRPGDPPELVADPKRANDLLGWRPTRSELEVIIHSAWKWHSGA